MTLRQDETTAQLDLTYDGPWPVAVRSPAGTRSGSAPLCAVCGGEPAHRTLDRQPGSRPAPLCLRCHRSVLRQRRKARAGRETADPGRADRGGLIVPRGSGLSAEAIYQRLSTSRRRAQKAARAAIGAG